MIYIYLLEAFVTKILPDVTHQGGYLFFHAGKRVRPLSLGQISQLPTNTL
jgi:hypothetical protein